MHILSIVSLLCFFSCANPPGETSKSKLNATTTTVEKTTPEETTKPSNPKGLELPPKSSEAWEEAKVDLKDFEKAFSKKEGQISSYAQINARYKLEDTFSGKSGSYIYAVSLRAQPKEQRVFKVLYAISPGQKVWDHFGFKEIYFSKRLSELGAHGQKSAMMPPGTSASIFFPKFYGFGFTHSTNPFKDQIISPHVYPYYVMERISGLALQDFALRPDKAREILGYSIDNAPEGVIFSILFQLSLALLNAELEFGFKHNDPHPKNIFLSTTPINLIVDAYDTHLRLEGPLLKILDFDQGEIPGKAATPWRGLKNVGRQLPLVGRIGEEEAFFDAVNPQARLGTWTIVSTKCRNNSPNIDMYMANLLIHTFENYFLDHGIDVSDKYFKTHGALLNFLRLNAYKLGLAKP